MEIGQRPWGQYEVLLDEPTYKVKRIIVLPGQRLSLQMHHRRAEHWTIVVGEADVTVNEDTFRLTPGEHVYIPLEAKHRVANPGSEPLVFIEVQSGTYTGEDDIVRFSDDYGRSGT
ncbi:MAG: phosphomannose isomerase type II C-terminal cupin domain [Elstera sp.]|jgi:mannose-6-phosphate isomerase-like protein (cupin superfamily)|uniref:phosphomannose isomerase type II C-terminal cupin domain n=1 Tax=Elstera sp. TaxID=1916664 RepID=UPI0037BF7802